MERLMANKSRGDNLDKQYARSVAKRLIDADVVVDCKGKPETRIKYLTERVSRILGGLSIGIETALPRTMRQTGQAFFDIETKGEALQGTWRGSNISEPLDINRLLVQRTSLVGGLNGPTGERLADMIVTDLRAGTAQLPGFAIERDPQGKLQLTWTPPGAKRASGEHRR